MPQLPLLRSLSQLQPLERIRAIGLAIALADLFATSGQILASGASVLARAVGVLAAVALGGYWARGFRRQSFALAGEPLEATGAFLILHAAPGNPFLPLCAVLFRSAYFDGGFVRVFGRYLLWVAALLGAHATRGHVQLQGDFARALGLAAAPLVMRLLALALARLQASERRLASLIQHSTDIVTVVAADLTICWQADSLLRVLGQEPAAVIGQPIATLIHPEDCWRFERYVERSRGSLLGDALF